MDEKNRNFYITRITILTPKMMPLLRP